MFEKKDFSVTGLHVDVISSGKSNFNKLSNQPSKETVKLFCDLDRIIRSAHDIHRRDFDYGLLYGDEMDMAFMYITRKGRWASLYSRGDESPSSLSFAHVQMKSGVKVFFVENPRKRRIYVVFSEKDHIEIAVVSEPWTKTIDFNKDDAVVDFYYSHFDDSPEIWLELLKFIERKPWNMFRVYKDVKEVKA